MLLLSSTVSEGWSLAVWTTAIVGFAALLAKSATFLSSQFRWGTPEAAVLDPTISFHVHLHFHKLAPLMGVVLLPRSLSYYSNGKSGASFKHV